MRACVCACVCECVHIRIRQIIERETEYQGTVHLGFVDLTKAYDSVDYSALQIRCLCDIVGVTLWDVWCNVDILEETGELPIKEQLRLKRLQWFGHLQTMPEHQPQKQLQRC